MESKHARVRMQQRGLPNLVVHWLLQYGEEEYDHDGGIVRYFSKQSKKQMNRDLGAQPVKKMMVYLDAYLVEMDGMVVTVGHRYKRINKH